MLTESIIQSIWVITHWFWFVIAGVLLIAEMFTMNSFFLWIAQGAIVTGLLAWLVPSLAIGWQIVFFVLASLLSMVAGYYFFRQPNQKNQPVLSKRGMAYIAQEYVLSEPIVNNQGLLVIEDTRWKITGEDCPAGSKVRVVALRGLVLVVEPVKQDDT